MQDSEELFKNCHSFAAVLLVESGEDKNTDEPDESFFMSTSLFVSHVELLELRVTDVDPVSVKMLSTSEWAMLSLP